MEKNLRIYYCLMAATAAAAVLTVMACVVIAEGWLVLTLAYAVPMALAIGVVSMVAYLAPTLSQPTPEGTKRRKRRTPYVPDTMGFRWVGAGCTSLAFAIIVLALAVWLMGGIGLWTFVAVAIAMLLAMYAADLYLTFRMYNIAGQPVPKRVYTLFFAEVADLFLDFFF